MLPTQVKVEWGVEGDSHGFETVAGGALHVDQDAPPGAQGIREHERLLCELGAGGHQPHPILVGGGGPLRVVVGPFEEEGGNGRVPRSFADREAACDKSEAWVVGGYDATKEAIAIPSQIGDGGEA
jgi:hypothetical protein